MSYFIQQLALLLLLLLSSKSSALSLESDKNALISFKSQISSESSNSLSSWNQNSSPCIWTGISCNKFPQRVVSLNLSSLGLVGSISPSIVNLSFLESLQLQNNQLTGTIPDQISNLLRLQELNISSNFLQGSVPWNISKLTKLTTLDLSMNHLTGKIPEEISLLPSLKVLNLGRNNLSGAVPSSIANLSSLEELILGTNSLSGNIPSDLNRLRNLKVLDFTINNLTGLVPSSIYNMSSLVNLALASNDLWGKLPSDIAFTLPNLLVLNLCFNKFSGTIPASLHNLTNIKVFRMANNHLQGTIPPGLGNLPFLEMYNIGYNRIVNSEDGGLGFINSLTNSTHLKFLAVDGNLFQGMIPESIGNLSKELQKLYMGSNNIYGTIPASIGGLKSLTLFNLSYNSIQGEIPPEIGQLQSLQSLVLAGNEITGRIPDSVGNLLKLNKIDLSQNGLSGPIPSTFGNLQSLLSLDLSKNKLNATIPKEILKLPSLSSILNLSNNFLSGNLLEEIGLLESLSAIDLSNNSLSGNIPDSIGNCKSLEKFYISRNQFSGHIPTTLGEVKGLEILDISYNNLSGSIPVELATLQALQSLNLAFNDLEGLTPCGGIFRNISEIQLQGNPRLSLHLACQKGGGRRKILIKVYIIVAIVAALAFCILIWSLFYSKRRNKAKTAHSANSIRETHPLISYHEIRQATNNFNQQNLIGSGGFGAVYKGYLVDGSDVAIKVIDVAKTGFQKMFLAECEALRNVRHRNLVKLITSCSSVDSKNKEFLALVYEYLDNGSLQDWIQGKRMKEEGNGLDLIDRLNVAIDVANGLDYLHNNCEVPIVHCDLKPSNILLDKGMNAKIGDFGLARLLKDQTSISSTHVLKGSIGYIPPEYGQGVKPSAAGDVYSLGVVLLELFTGKSPTDDMFMGGQTLVGWVQSAFPANTLQVLDPELDNFGVDNVGKSETIKDCLTTVLGIGLACAATSPDGRLSIGSALSKLVASKDYLLKHASLHNPCLN